MRLIDVQLTDSVGDKILTSSGSDKAFTTAEELARKLIEQFHSDYKTANSSFYYAALYAKNDSKYFMIFRLSDHKEVGREPAVSLYVNKCSVLLWLEKYKTDAIAKYWVLEYELQKNKDRIVTKLTEELKEFLGGLTNGFFLDDKKLRAVLKTRPNSGANFYYWGNAGIKKTEPPLLAKEERLRKKITVNLPLTPFIPVETADSILLELELQRMRIF
jgi:hypothetical protein